MYKSICILLSVLLFFTQTSAQLKEDWRKIADSLYKAKQYPGAAKYYLLTADNENLRALKKSHYYNAACCFALDGDKEKALTYLKLSVFQLGYKNLDHLQNDSDLNSLHEEKEWREIIQNLQGQKELMKDPLRAKLVTSDIYNFWNAWDAAQRDSSNNATIFRQLYFDKGSIGLEDYYALKIGSLESFVRNQNRKPKFYKAIRENTFKIDGMKEQMTTSFKKLKTLYPESSFPDIYFLIGRWNSAGTVSDNGLLLGVDQIVRTPDIPQEELILWEKNNFQELSRIPVIVAHELIHFQQNAMGDDTTLLCYAIREGMADFIGELISGENASKRQQEFAKGKRKKIWEDFKKEMYLDRAYNWIANGDQESADKPADLGYYMGYEICKSYYEQSPDKNQAIYDMLHINDYKAFLEKSKYEAKVSMQD